MTDFSVHQAPDHIARRRVLVIGIGSIVVTAAALVVAWVLLGHWGEPARRGAPPPAPSTIGLLEQSLIVDTDRGARLLEKQRAELETWGWVDADAGVARIPIGTAIDLLVTSPLPIDQPLERPRPEAP